MPSIAKHSVLVIGGSSGIGHAVAQLALDQNTRVFISSSNPARISSAVNSIREKFPDGHIEGFPCDLNSAQVESNLEKLLTQVVAANGGQLLDHIVFTAGDTLPIKPLTDIDHDFIHNAGQVRFVAPLLVGKLAPRFLKQSYTSSFTLTGGMIARKPYPDWSIAAGYMSGLEGMTKNLALDLKPIRVNLVLPGGVDTDLWGTVEERKGTMEMLKKISLQDRVASAAEVAESYIYLLRDTNATGSTVTTDGGVVLI
jgi:NAD(P)-dependent dehydrogenase (short-subunit alcohol dehydrogenase family)